MLDVMEGGPKLRKWYGEDSSVGKDGEVKRERRKGGKFKERGTRDANEDGQ